MNDMAPLHAKHRLWDPHGSRPEGTVDSSQEGLQAVKRGGFLNAVSLLLASSWLAVSPALCAPPHYSRFLLGAYRKTIEIEPDIESTCKQYGVSVRLARAVCMYESGGNDSLVSSAGARGYFQVMPATQRRLGVASNIEAGIKYLGELVRILGREDTALAAYNTGPARLVRGRPLPMETLQYVLGVGHLRALMQGDEAEMRAECSKVLLHKVVEGESWLDISQATGTTLLELRLFNPYLADRPLLAGESIAYPSEPAASVSEVLQWSEPESCWTYRTLPGDLYHHLAVAFGVPYDRLRADNDLWRVQTLVAGMVLRIRPGDEGPGQTHVVVQGESVASIAGECSVSPWDLIRENGLWDQKLEVGRILRVTSPSSQPAVSARRVSLTTGRTRSSSPHAAAPVAAAPPPGSETTAPETPGSSAEKASRVNLLIHKVRRGDTLGRLARLYGTKVELIRSLNGLRGTRLTVGQFLRIPLSSSS